MDKDYHPIKYNVEKLPEEFLTLVGKNEEALGGSTNFTIIKDYLIDSYPDVFYRGGNELATQEAYIAVGTVNHAPIVTGANWAYPVKWTQTEAKKSASYNKNVWVNELGLYGPELADENQKKGYALQNYKVAKIKITIEDC